MSTVDVPLPVIFEWFQAAQRKLFDQPIDIFNQPPRTFYSEVEKRSYQGDYWSDAKSIECIPAMIYGLCNYSKKQNKNKKSHEQKNT